MRAIKSAVKLDDYKRELVRVLDCDDNYKIFIDTNILALSFRLNHSARSELFDWFRRLGDKLIIPAWVVHEYNTHLRRKTPDIFYPNKRVGKSVLASLSEAEKLAALLIDDSMLNEPQDPSREEYLGIVSKAADTIRHCINKMDRMAPSSLRGTISAIEGLISNRALSSDIQELTRSVAADARIRFSHRLSPAHQDAAKEENAFGDLILWKEILETCKAGEFKFAVLITSDQKSDWMCSPNYVELPNGKEIDGTSEKVSLVKLPNPDLVSEFSQYTGSNNFHIYPMDTVIQSLSSVDYAVESSRFRNLAAAMKIKFNRSPTESAIDWFLRNEEMYNEAIRGVCRWEFSPSEVDFEEFEKWAVEKMGEDKTRGVEWGVVFCELFL